MPPFVNHKRLGSTSPASTSRTRKPTLFDTVDKPTSSSTVQDNKAFVDGFYNSDSTSSLSDVSSSEFEDVVPQPSSKKRKTEHEEDDDEVDWEDAIQATKTGSEYVSLTGRHLGDLELTLGKSIPVGSLAEPYGKKKGPSKIERQIRIATHCMHVQFLLFHNLIRNGWICDTDVQATLMGQLPPGVKKEVEKWKLACGTMPTTQDDVYRVSKEHRKNKRRSHKDIDNIRSQREWGKPAERQEKGAPNMSSGDPTLRLLRVLAAYWKKRFTITMPSLRKQGYKSLAQLEAELASFKNDKHNAEEHGERINGLNEFRKLAKDCEGSRDVGEQLFVSLIRSLGIQARLVSSLQPVGFGWSKNEDAAVKKKTRVKPHFGEESNNEASSDLVEIPKPSKPASRHTKSKPKISRQGKEAPASASEESVPEIQEIVEDSDADGSIVDVTPVTLQKRKPNKNYDNDMSFPTFWAEAISPITSEVYPVEPFLLNPAVANNAEHLASFEPRGAKADKAKIVFAYVVAYDDRGCAKDVTTRYLKRHMWPGRTKGVRMPVERIPVYNKRGKIKHHEDYDWFKTVMSNYRQPHHMRTTLDDLEDANDLKAVKPEKRETKQGEDTLQGYKTSAEYVLERFLRREEALRPGSIPVKYFTTGKGDTVKEEPVFLRKDVLICRTGESWHKEGRQVKHGEHPMKMVPIRAVTLTRKREVEEAEREGGEKMKQGMYSQDQTEYIIPPPIENGIIPKNTYGNMDCFVPSMVPKGAVHIPLRRTMAICKRLGIDYAEAVTGFEFGNKRAVPVIEGVIVAAKNENLVIEEWGKDEEERRRKEESKREKVALATWRKFLMGLRIIERMKDEYSGEVGAHLKESINPFTNLNKVKKSNEVQHKDNKANGQASSLANEDNAGGFLVDDASDAGALGGGFILGDDDQFEDTDSRQAGSCLTDHENIRETAFGKGDLIIENEDAVHRKGFENISDASELPEPEDELGDPMDIEPEETCPVKKRGRPKKTVVKKPESKIRDSRAITKTANVLTSNGKPDLSHSSDNGQAVNPTHQTTTPKATAASRVVRKSRNSDQGPSLEIEEEHPKRKAPKRKAARQSAGVIKSHYFDHSSDEGQTSDVPREESGGSSTAEFASAAKTKKRGRAVSKHRAGTRKTR